MYPETDIPSIQLTHEYLAKLKSCLPELPEQEMTRLMKEYNINRKLAKQIMDSEYTKLFETIATGTRVSPTVIAVALTETMKALKREGIKIQRVADDRVGEMFHLISSGKTTKEAIPDIITWLAEHKEKTAKDAVESLGLVVLTERELEVTIDKLVKQNEPLIQDRGRGAFGALMGVIMKEVRGRAKVEVVSKILKRKLEALAEQQDKKLKHK